MVDTVASVPALDPTIAPYFDEQGNLDPMLVAAVKGQESNGNPYAVSPKGAKGLMQLMDATGQDEFNKLSSEEKAQYGGEYNPFNTDLNEKLGTGYLAKQIKEFKDVNLGLTAYNAGPGKIKKMQEAGFTDFESIKSNIDKPEQQTYADNVMTRYGKLKNNLPQSAPSIVAKLPKPDLTNTTSDASGFSDATLPIVSDPHFPLLSFNDQAKALTDVINGKRWNSDAYALYKKQMDLLWQSADPREIPSMQDVLSEVGGGPAVAPFVEAGQNPDEVLANWRQSKQQALLNKGILPDSFGSQLDNYFDKSIANEKTDFTRRNKSTLSSVGDFAYTAAEAGLSVPFSAIAGVTRLADSAIQGPQKAGIIADAIQENANFLSRDPADYRYELDDNGKVKLDKNFQPITKFSAKVADFFGSTAGFLAGGAALKSLDVVAVPMKAIAGIDFAANTSLFANESFKSVYEKTGDINKAYQASLYALPAAMVASLGHVGVIGKMLNPAVEGLEPFSKAKYIANVMARNAAFGGATMAGADLIQQYGETSQTGEAYDPSRTGAAALGGGVAAGVLSGVSARNVSPGVKPVEVSPSPLSETQINQLALPMPDERKGLPAGNNFTALPPFTERLGLPSPYVSSPPTKEAPKQIDPSVAAKVVTKIEEFRKSSASGLNITEEEARNLPHDMLIATDTILTPSAEGGYQVARKSDYTPITLTDINELSAKVDSLKEELQASPTPEYILKGQQRLRQITQELIPLEKKLGEKGIQAHREYTNLDTQLNETKAKKEKAYIDGNHAEGNQYATHQAEIENAINAHSEKFKDVYSPNSKLSELSAEKARLEKEVNLPITVKDYVSNLQIKDKELAAKQRALKVMQDELAAKGNEPVNAIMVRDTIPVEDYAVTNVNDKWYVVDKNNDIVGGAHDYYYDALDTVKQARSIIEPNESTQFLMREENNGALSKTTVKAIEDKVRADTEAKVKNDEISKQVKDIFYRTEVKKALKAEKARQKELTKARKKAGVELPPREEAPKGVFASPSEEVLGLNTAQKAKSVTEGTQPEKVLNKLSTDEGFAQHRRVVNKPQKPLTSNYTKLTDFPQTSTKQVPFEEVYNKAADLMQAMDKKFKLLIGGLKNAGARAYFHDKKYIIKLGRWGEPQELIHELTHLIDAKLIGKWLGGKTADYSQLSPRVQEAAIDQAATFYRFRTPPSRNLLLKEGLTTFIQHYASGQPVRKELLDWYHKDFARENPEVYKNLEDLKNTIHDYYNQTDLTFGKSQTIPKSSFKEAVDKAKNYFTIDNLRDQWSRTSQFYKDIQKADPHGAAVHQIYLSTKHAAEPMADTITTSHRLDAWGNPKEGLPLADIFNNYMDQGLPREDIFQYLRAWDALANIKKGLDVGLPEAEAKGIIRELDNRPNTGPLFRKMKNEYAEFMDYKDDLRASFDPQSAMVVAAERKANTELGLPQHGDYFPIQRAGKGAPKSSKGRVGSSGPVQDSLGHLQDAIKEQLQQANVSQLLGDVASIANNDNLAPTGQFIRRVRGAERVKALDSLRSEATKGLPDVKANEEDLLKYSYGSPIRDGITSSKFNTFTYHDGKELGLYETDARMAATLDRKVPMGVNNWFYRYMVQPGNSLLRLTATSLRVPFQEFQAIRDPLSAFSYIMSQPTSSWKDGMLLMGDIINGITDTLIHTSGTSELFKRFGFTKAGDYTQFLENHGLNHSPSLDFDKEIRSRSEAKYGVGNVVNYLDAAGDALMPYASIIERGVRQGAIRNLNRQAGINIDTPLTRAQHHALRMHFLESTANFGDAGQSARAASRYIPFSGARQVELTKWAEQLARSPKRIAAISTLTAIAGYMYAMSKKDDKDYQELSTQQKISSINFAGMLNGVAKQFYLPLDTNSQIPFAIGTAIALKAAEDPSLPVSHKEMAAAFMNEFLPINQSNIFNALGTPLKTAIELTANYSFYNQKAITPEYMKRKDIAERFNEYTSEFAKKLGPWAGVAPNVVDYAIKSAAPAASDYLSYFDQLAGYKNPKEYAGLNFLARAFTRPGSADSINTRSQNLFNDNLQTYRAGQLTESPEQAEIRKNLERANTTLSQASMLIKGVDDQKVKQPFIDKMREVYKQANAIARGEPGYIPPSPLSHLAKAAREEAKQLQRKNLLEQASHKDNSFVLEGDTTVRPAKE